MHGSDTETESLDLCRRCATGDEDAFREVYRMYGGALYGTAWRILRRPQDAEEVVQEAFLTLYRVAADKPPHNLGAWLHRVTANRAVDRLRKRSRRGEVELFDDFHADGADAAPARNPVLDTGGGAPSGTKSMARDVGIDIERAVARLPERARMVFLLHDVEGFKHREIGEIMGISDGSSKSQLSRARGMLRGWLQEGGGDE